MKMRPLTILNLGIIFSLCSCVIINHRRNNVVAGEFEGVDSKNEDISCFLNVKEISEAEYYAANYIDVVEDLVKGGYYSLDFFTRDKSGTETYYHFNKFSDFYHGATGTPIRYVDASGNELYPCTSIDKDVSTAYYSIGISESENNEMFVTFVYIKENSW